MDQTLELRLPELERRRRLKRALGLLVTVVAGGTIGFVIIEGWAVWRALFFTLITITTVGYGDEGISETGKKFASFLLVSGIGVSSYAFALLVQNAVTNQYAWKNRMQKRINKVSKHTIICGFGRMGKEVCAQLRSAGVPLVVIELDTKSFHEACDLGFLAVEGCSSDDDVLMRAGIMEASNIVSTVSVKAENVFTALSARQLRPDITIIARSACDEEARKLAQAGATRVISPYQSGGQRIADLILRPGVADFIERSQTDDGGVVFADISVNEGSDLCGYTLAEYGKQFGTKIAFVALQRGSKEFRISPPGNSRLRTGDRLIVAGDPVQVERMTESASIDLARA